MRTSAGSGREDSFNVGLSATVSHRLMDLIPDVSQNQQKNSGNRLATVNIQDVNRANRVQHKSSGNQPATVNIKSKEVNFNRFAFFCAAV